MLLVLRAATDTYLTPLEKLRSLENWEQYLKPGITENALQTVEQKQSDNECTALMQKIKLELFTRISRESRKT
jgi:hypothetical protein